jgi:lysozyme family protein
MSKVSLTPELRQEYELLFNSCMIKFSKIAIVEKVIQTILTHKQTYQQVEKETSVPWFFIGAIHNLEAGLNFKTHLHNGDPLTAKTTHVPKGRPTKGNPPFSWSDSAADALTFDGLASVTDWSLATTLFNMEKYNGWGYRSKHPEVLSPYLWSYSTHYTSGKYVADGTWSSTAVSNQAGGAVVLRRMAEEFL